MSELEKADMCYFSQLVLIFRPRARKTMREECFTHFIISTRAITTSAISINNAFSCYLQIFHSFIGHLRCFVANLLVLIFLNLFLYLCFFNRFFHLCELLQNNVLLVSEASLRFPVALTAIRMKFMSMSDTTKLKTNYILS